MALIPVEKSPTNGGRAYVGQVGNFWGATDRSQNVVTSLWFLLPIQYLRYHSVSDPLDYHWLLAGRVYTQNEWSRPRGFPAGVGRVLILGH